MACVTSQFPIDETFVGGLEKNKHKDKKRNAGRGGASKTVVLGILERGNGTKDENGNRATISTDAHRGYNGLEQSYIHAFVDLAVKYAEGNVTTNGIENFW